MAEYIEREALREKILGQFPDAHYPSWYAELLNEVPTTDVVEADKVAEMLYEVYGDPCACNYNNNDEWLSEACEYDFDECPEPKDPLGCWKQYVKHYGERRNDD